MEVVRRERGVVCGDDTRAQRELGHYTRLKVGADEDLEQPASYYLTDKVGLISLSRVRGDQISGRV